MQRKLFSLMLQQDIESWTRLELLQQVLTTITDTTKKTGK
jgi:hypothetical protein